MIVHNPNNLLLIDYREVKPLQGELKDLSEANYKKLANVLNKRGFTTPLFVWNDGTDNYLMDGHQRQRVMLGEDMQPYEVPYILIEADNIKDAKAQLLEITSQYGTITQEGFDTYIAQAELPEAEMMESINFDALNWTQPEPEVEEDEAPEVSSEPPKSKLGEIYQLGRHRVMCGDSTDKEQVLELMGGGMADMVFTDPPYNVDYEGKTKDALKIDNDNKTDSDFFDFLIDAYGAMFEVSKGGATFYICHADTERINFTKAFLDAGGYLSSVIIWVKNNATFGRQNYFWKHEPILYGWKNTGAHKWYGNNTETTIWNIDRPSRSEEHPTMKPLALIARALNNSSKQDDVVLDTFLGSGSTLIACEQTQRICYGMELDPKYVDVIRKRYYNYMTDEGESMNWEEYTPSMKRLEVN